MPRLSSTPDLDLAQKVGGHSERLDTVEGRVVRLASLEEKVDTLIDDVRKLTVQLGTPPDLDKPGTGLTGAVYELVPNRRRGTLVAGGSIVALVVSIIVGVLQAYAPPAAARPATVQGTP